MSGLLRVKRAYATNSVVVLGRRECAACGRTWEAHHGEHGAEVTRSRVYLSLTMDKGRVCATHCLESAEAKP